MTLRVGSFRFFGDRSAPRRASHAHSIEARGPSPKDPARDRDAPPTLGQAPSAPARSEMTVRIGSFRFLRRPKRPSTSQPRALDRSAQTLAEGPGGRSGCAAHPRPGSFRACSLRDDPSERVIPLLRRAKRPPTCHPRALDRSAQTLAEGPGGRSRCAASPRRATRAIRPEPRRPSPRVPSARREAPPALGEPPWARLSTPDRPCASGRSVSRRPKRPSASHPRASAPRDPGVDRTAARAFVRYRDRPFEGHEQEEETA